MALVADPLGDAEGIVRVAAVEVVGDLRDQVGEFVALERWGRAAQLFRPRAVLA